MTTQLIMEEILGSIVELKLRKKLEQAKLLIFDNYNGISTRLHISKLSNNPTLSEKMFKLIEVGEEVTAVIIGYDEERNCYELSTKVFRNALDDVMTFSTCRNLVNQEYNEYFNLSERHIKNYRGILNRLQGDLSSDKLTFLYELLQNAVDHPNRNFNNELRVKFEVFGDYLLLKHNGSLFTKNNFISLTGILRGEEEVDETEVRRVGYKGIGFKSVFRYSSNVYVRSGNFSFSFEQLNLGANYPWEVMPIFQDERNKIDEIRQFEFFNDPVAFAFKFNNEKQKKEVSNYLEELSKNPYLLIFLNRLSSLEIITENINSKLEKSIDTSDILTLYKNGKKISSWLQFSNQFTIEDKTVIDELTDESNKSIPENFRKFRCPEVNILIPIEKEENLINLFYFLPLSRTRHNLEYIVNADFIPNLDRTDYINKLEYNQKVIDFISIQILRTCIKLSSSKKYKLLTKLFPVYEGSNIEYKNLLQKHFLEKLNNYKIFPNFYNENLTEFKNLTIDTTGIYDILNQEEYKSLINTNGNPLNPAFEQIDKVDRLKQLSQTGSSFNIEELKEKINKEAFQNWLKTASNNQKFIEFIVNNEYLKPLTKSKVFLTSKGELKKANEIYRIKPESLNSFNIDVLHQNISLQVATLETLTFKEYEVNDIVSNLFNVNNAIFKDSNQYNKWNFIYDEWELIKDKPELIKELKTQNIQCKNNKFINVSKTYISKEYNKSEPIEELINELELNNISFISQSFISEFRNSDKWYLIFKKLNAKTDLQAVITDIIENIDSFEADKHFKLTQEIFKYWKRNKENSNKAITSNQFNKLRNKLRLLTKNNAYKTANEGVILADEYTTNKPLSQVLKSINLDNVLSEKYIDNINNINLWYSFYTELRVNEINDKNKIIENKIQYYINTIQEDDSKLENFRVSGNYYVFLEELSTIANTDVRLKKESITKIKIYSNKETWCIGSDVHISSIYCNKNGLDLQRDNNLTNISYLNNNFNPQKISRKLLKQIGVNFNFKVSSNLTYRKDLNSDYLAFIDQTDSSIRNNAYSWGEQHRISNHIKIENIELLKNSQYVSMFWDKIKNKDVSVESLTEKSNYNYYYGPTKIDNFFVFYIKNNPCFLNRNNQLKTTTDLFSNKLEAYIQNDDLLPLYDFSEEIVNGKSVEELLGVQTELTSEIALKLIEREKPELTKEEVETLNLLGIIEGAELNDNTIYYLPNLNFEWTPTTDLIIGENDEFENEIPDNQRLHSEFRVLADKFNINTLSESSLINEFENSEIDAEFTQQIKDRLKYVAFKITESSESYVELKDTLQEKLNQVKLYQCDSIVKKYPKENPIFSKEIESLLEEHNFYYTSDEILLKFIFNDIINSDKIRFPWFKKVISRWNDEEIQGKINDDFDTLSPWYKGTKEPDTDGKERKPNKFKGEVEELIKSLENTSWSGHIEELKQLLLGADQPKVKQQLHNKIAKLRLGLQIGADDDNTNEFNYLVTLDETFIVHSARGPFAYIHPKEIIEMEEEGTKMALDWGSNAPISIYHTASDLLNKNDVQLLRYAFSKNIDDILEFCRENNKSKRHLLFVDGSVDINKNKSILKILGNQDEY